MPRKPATISNRTIVILDNIDTVRQIQHVLREGEFYQDLHSLLSGVNGHIRDWLPDFPCLRSEIVKRDLDLRIVLDECWHGIVAISISFQGLLNPGFYDSRDDPYVGFWVAADANNEDLSKRLIASAPVG